LYDTRPTSAVQNVVLGKSYVIGMQESNLFNVPITFQVDESSLNIRRWRVFNFVYCNQVRAVLPACKNIAPTDHANVMVIWQLPVQTRTHRG